jgi:hypothetical protein
MDRTCLDQWDSWTPARGGQSHNRADLAGFAGKATERHARAQAPVAKTLLAIRLDKEQSSHISSFPAI